jgi:hypothetical protein
MNKVKEWLGISRADLTVPPDVKDEMYLYLGGVLVGTLSVSDGLWMFGYSDEFKKESLLRPLVEFPDVDTVYQSPELWQFFASRIPHILQPDVEEVLQREHIDETNIVALLKRFGGRTITNPYELRSDQTAWQTS